MAQPCHCAHEVTHSVLRPPLQLQLQLPLQLQLQLPLQLQLQLRLKLPPRLLDIPCAAATAGYT